MSKIDLSDATFIVPIRIESDDRLRNIVTTLCYLISNFNTNVIVKEVDNQSVFEEYVLPQIKEFCVDISCLTHIFEKSEDFSFHRQKVLNEMIMMSKTKVIVNYDCDVLFLPQVYQMAYESILKGESEVVYPYGDGDNWQKQVFADDELVSDFLNKNFDFRVLESKSKTREAKYGFCQFFNRDVYIEGGMENENFIAYAPEDVERYHRFTFLGYKVNRIDAHVYHLEHKRTPNSWFNNPHMNSNNDEWMKITKMDKEELKEYIINQDYYKKYVN